MDKKYILIIFLVMLLVVAGVKSGLFQKLSIGEKTNSNFSETLDDQGGFTSQNPLSIEYMRQQEYPGSEMTIEEVLPNGSNYFKYIASYKSDGLKIYGLLTVPFDLTKKYPAIIFNHGYIPPEQYVTTERYVAYTDAFSRNGYILFKPDYRGHGNSEGRAEGGYYSPGYTRDVLNAVASLKRLKSSTISSSGANSSLVDQNKIGMWGHSMGGALTLKSMVISKDIKVGVIWGGVVASYQDLISNWRRATPFTPSQREQLARRNSTRQKFIDQYGTPSQNPSFWNSISAINYVADISGPIQLHHAKADEEVPWEFSQNLYDALIKAGKTGEVYFYENDNHNISNNFNTAMERSVAFMDKYLK